MRAVGGGTNDVWNFCSMQSDYSSNGVPLLNAGGNAGSATLFAYIGPCATPYAVPPTNGDWGDTLTSDGVPTTLTYIAYSNNVVTTTNSTSTTKTTTTQLFSIFDCFLFNPIFDLRLNDYLRGIDINGDPILENLESYNTTCWDWSTTLGAWNSYYSAVGGAFLGNSVLAAGAVSDQLTYTPIHIVLPYGRGTILGGYYISENVVSTIQRKVIPSRPQSKPSKAAI